MLPFDWIKPPIISNLRTYPANNNTKTCVDYLIDLFNTNNFKFYQQYGYLCTKRTENFINTMFYKIPLKCFYFLWCERLIFYIIFILLFFFIFTKYERIANLVYFAYIFYMKIEMAALGARNCILDNISINNGTHK